MINTLDKVVKGRFFLVGCPRSGTTLLTSFLAAHPQIASFPETNFFYSITGQYEPRIFGRKPSRLIDKLRKIRSNLRVRLGVAFYGIQRPIPSPVMHDLLTDIDRKELQDFFPKNFFLMQHNVDAYTKIMDWLTIEKNKDFWLDKSTVHLGYIDIIERFFPDTKIIHIIRDGKDVVASIYDAAQKYPDTVWGLRYPDLDSCIDIWNKSIQISSKYIDKPNHKLIRYESLVNNPQLVVQELCDFLKIKFDDVMIQDRRKSLQQVSIENEQRWKSSVAEKIKNKNGTKFYALFSKKEQKYIANRLIQIEI